MKRTLIISAVAWFILFFCAVLFVNFIPSVWGEYATQRLLLSVSFITLISLGLLRLIRRGIWVPSLLKSLPFLPLLLSFILVVFQYPTQPFYSVEPIFYSLFFLTFGICGYLIWAEGVAYEVARALAMVAAIACFFYAAMTLTVYLFAVNDRFSRLDNLIPWGFVNIRYWSHVATWVVPLFPLCLLVAPCKDNRLWRLGVGLTAAIWWWILLMSSSRGSMIGLLIGFVLVCVLFGRTALPWAGLFIRFAVYGMLAWCVLSLAIPSLVFEDLQVRGIKGHTSGRIPMWQEAWAMSLQYFPFGMGSQAWLTHDTLTDAYRGVPKIGHPHNMYLMWAAEYGWLSIAGLGVLGSVALRRLWLQIPAARAGNARTGLLLVGFTASVTGALIHAGVSAVFIAPGSMLIGLLILSVFWALIMPKPATSLGLSFRKRPRISMLAGYLIAVGFALAVSFWFREVLRYQQAMTDDLACCQNEVPQRMLPRFWFHGNFPRHPAEMPQRK